ncbi:MAG: dihydrolipoyl dehydrogenase [Leptospiraceae bacterium]|nr:dihydrolipoyl dehydrogenase [Leptospiraceae bacterium]
MAPETQQFDLIVLGGGPGGYVCAIRASQLGLKTALVEKRATIGGTCVNVGCIPSKALLDSSHRYHDLMEGLTEHGIEVEKPRLNLKAMMDRKTGIVKELTDGLDFLMKKNKITVLRGTGSFIGQKDGQVQIQVEGQNGSAVAQAGKVVIATGSEVIPLPGLEVDGEHIITSDHAIALQKVPEHLVIIGGGVIGLELGSVWKRLGARVTVIELLPGILMGLDRQMRELALRLFKQQGLEFLFEHKVVGAENKKGQVEIKIVDKDDKEAAPIIADKLLVAVGRRPFTDKLNLESVGVKLTERGRVAVDGHSLQTSNPLIYAIGDVIDGPMLAHKAEEEGVKIAEDLAGKSGHVNYNAVPFVVYSWPEIAWVGKGEDELKAAGIPYNSGKFLFRPNGRAKAMGAGDGQVKILAHKETDELLGIAIVGPGASELIAEAVIAIEFGAAAEDIARSFHAHPTLAEVMKEAALAVDRRALHA